MKRYRRVVDEISAEVLTKTNAEELAHLCNGQVVNEIDPFDSRNSTVGLNVPSLSGNFRVSEGEVLVKQSSGWTKMTPDILNDRFAPVD